MKPIADAPHCGLAMGPHLDKSIAIASFLFSLYSNGSAAPLFMYKGVWICEECIISGSCFQIGYQSELLYTVRSNLLSRKSFNCSGIFTLHSSGGKNTPVF